MGEEPSYKTERMKLQRIVKMSFQPEKVNDFLRLYSEVQHKISSFPGCHGVKLLREKKEGSIFFTYSVWDSERDLNSYRSSELFSRVWKEMKSYCNDRPEAWSLDHIEFSE